MTKFTIFPTVLHVMLAFSSSSVKICKLLLPIGMQLFFLLWALNVARTEECVCCVCVSVVYVTTHSLRSAVL